MKTLARQRDKAEILHRLKMLQPGSVGRWGKMSVHQMVCHLADSLRMVTGERSVSPDTSFVKQTMLKWAVLYAPLRWPAGIRTSPELDQEQGGTSPVDFAADIAQVEALLDIVTSSMGTFDRRSHPFFGSMSDAAWLRWCYLHMDHHLRQFGA